MGKSHERNREPGKGLWHDAYDKPSSSQWSSVVDRGLALQGQPVDRNAESDARRLRTHSNDGDVT